MATRTFSFEAFKIEYNDSFYYVGVIESKKLFQLCRVSRAEEDPKKGFQRTLGQKRAKKIASYLKSGNIILSAKKGVVKTYNKKTKKLTINNIDGGFLVIDGQHRLYGAELSGINIQFPVCIFDGIDLNQEVQYFLDVNGYQIGVPRTLQLELTKFLAEPDSEDMVYNALFDSIATTPKSPLYGKMARTKSVTGKISHVAFRTAVKEILHISPFSSFDITQKKAVLLNYLVAADTILKENFDIEPRLTNAAFFQAIVIILNDVCSISLASNGDLKVDSLQKILEPIHTLNYETHKGTNKKAIKALSIELKNLVSARTKFSGDIF